MLDGGKCEGKLVGKCGGICCGGLCGVMRGRDCGRVCWRICWRICGKRSGNLRGHASGGGSLSVCDPIPFITNSHPRSLFLDFVVRSHPYPCSWDLHPTLQCVCLRIHQQCAILYVATYHVFVPPTFVSVPHIAPNPAIF